METAFIALFVLLSLAILYAGIRWGVDTLRARRVVRENERAEAEWRRELDQIDAEWDRKFDTRYPSMCQDLYDEKADQ